MNAKRWAAVLTAGLVIGCAEARPAGPADPAELEAFLDGVMAAHAQSRRFAGAAVAVVRDGKLLFQKGYGWADVAARKRVDPERTLFRIASVSKLFTWTAVMQLVERGELDLDRDVNTYLGGLRIPAIFPQPVTMAHLMTHTPGFEDHVVGLFARASDRMRPLGDLLRAEMPARVRPPGLFTSYSNHGSALAAYIVEKVSGLPWETYVEKNILQPLGMQRTTVRQPVPARLAGGLATGYRYSEPDQKEQGFEYVPLGPAGGMSATAADMARFMAAHLNHGRYGGAEILSEKTARLMERQLFTHDRHVNGVLHGFMELSRNGHRIMGHGGDTLWFHSQLMLFPDSGVGLFVSYNSNTGAGAREHLIGAFIDRYYPAAEVNALAPRPGARERAERLAGEYASIRVSHSSPAKMSMLVNTMRVSVDGQGRLLTRSGAGAKRWLELEPLVYRQADSLDTLVFRQDAGAWYAFSSRSPYAAYARLGLTETAALHYTAGGVSAALLLSGIFFWPRALLAARRRGRPWASADVAASVSGGLLSVATLLFVAGFGIGMSDPKQIVFGIPPPLSYALLLTPAIAALVLLTLALGAAAWRSARPAVSGRPAPHGAAGATAAQPAATPVERWSAAMRIYFGMVIAAGITLVWWLRYWNLL